MLSFVLASCGRESVSGRDRPMPESYALLEDVADSALFESLSGGTIVLETIVTGKADFEAWKSTHSKANVSATLFRREVQEWIRQERGRIMDTQVVQATFGRPAVVTTTLEVISQSPLRENSRIPFDVIYPSAELKVNLKGGSSDGDFLLSLSRRQSHQLHGGVAINSLPGAAQSVMETTIKMKPGQYGFLGTRVPGESEILPRIPNPIILTFVRVDTI